jgi:hypothetical protein
MVKHGRTLLAAAARPDTNNIGHALHDIAEPHVLVSDEARKANAMSLALAFMVAACFVVHDRYLLAWMLMSS